MSKCDSGISVEKALKIVSTCRADRLPYVLDILRGVGYDFSDDAIWLARKADKTKLGREAERRKSAEK